MKIRHTKFMLLWLFILSYILMSDTETPTRVCNPYPNSSRFNQVFIWKNNIVKEREREVKLMFKCSVSQMGLKSKVNLKCYIRNCDVKNTCKDNFKIRKLLQQCHAPTFISNFRAVSLCPILIHDMLDTRRSTRIHCPKLVPKSG